MSDFILFFLVGFCAQLVDGALGMAYGLTSTTLLLSLGVPPAAASATTHAAECITTGFSALAHHHFGNIHFKLFRKLLIPGMLGSIAGVILVSNVDSNRIKPLIVLYLAIMGLTILIKAIMEFPPRTVNRHLIPLGFFGGFMDAMGGGGWGPLVTSTLLVRGNDPRMTIGTVNATEFFVAMIATVAFFASGISVPWQTVTALALGGALAAPLGAWVCRHLPHKVLLIIVGFLIIGLSIRILIIWLGGASI